MKSRKTTGNDAIPLRRWLWRSYLYSAIVPLLFIELTFIAIYWASSAIVYRENVGAVRELATDYLADVARREAISVSNSLDGVSRQTTVYARQTLKALQGNYDPPAAEKARYARSPGGAFYTTRDNGSTASFYSGARPIGPAEIAKVWKLAALDPLMIDLQKSNPLIASLYFNTFDSYNRIYPYFPVLEQYPARMDIPTYNFYYEADASHNPQRKQVWTDAYIDPAGHGWMVSSIAPVWNGNRLEGVVGIDVTLDTIIARLMELDMPWDGYAVLVDRQGGIIALPPKGEADFGLKELTNHHYADAIQSDTFKPDAFNVFKRADTQALAQAIRKAREGHATITFDGPHQASFARIAGPEWTLVLIAPEKQMYAHAEELRQTLQTVGIAMLGGLVLFYIVFFVFLWGRARIMSDRVAAPLGDIANLVGRIGAGEHRQNFAGSQVRELDDLGTRLVATGEQLGEAHDRIVAQERIVSEALARQQQVNEEQVRFIRVMSHELRTPLSVIDSGAQIIDRKAEMLAPQQLRDRMTKVRSAVHRISDLLAKLVATAAAEAGDTGNRRGTSDTADLRTLVTGIAGEMVPAERLRTNIATAAPLMAENGAVAIALRAALDNAVRYADADSPIHVALSDQDGQAVLTVADEGPGIPENELAQVGERFFRGERSTGTVGAGVGLHVARRVVEGIGGRLAIASGPGGTTVTLTVPTQPGQASAVKLETAP